MDTQAELRRDIRELGALLGRTLVRQEGQALYDLVERVRQLIREDRDQAVAQLGEVEPATARRLVRAFSIYFHLANIAEQVHRGRELAALRVSDGTWLSQAVDRIQAAEVAEARAAGRARPARRAAGVHRASDRGGPADGARQARPGRRSPRRARPGSRRRTSSACGAGSRS